MYVDEDRVLATRTGTMQIGPMLGGVVSMPARYTGWEVSIAIAPCTRIAKDPRTKLVIDRQWDVSGMPHLVAL